MVHQQQPQTTRRAPQAPQPWRWSLSRKTSPTSLLQYWTWMCREGSTTSQRRRLSQHSSHPGSSLRRCSIPSTCSTPKVACRRRHGLHHGLKHRTWILPTSWTTTTCPAISTPRFLLGIATRSFTAQGGLPRTRPRTIYLMSSTASSTRG